MFEIVKRRYWFFALSLLVILPGLIGLGIWGLPLSIDFTGGSLLELQFPQTTKPVDTAETTLVYEAQGYKDTRVQTSGADVLIIRSAALTAEAKQTIQAELAKLYGPATVLSDDMVSASVGQKVAQSAAAAIGLAAVGIMLYIWLAFRKVNHAFRYGVCAIVAMLHDIAVVIGLAALLGHFLDWQVDALYLTAVLTVASFSVHDTIVVFDRIRENLKRHARLDYETVVNHSIVQTLDRSINTQLTVMLVLLALVLFGGVTTRHFVTILLIGVFSGTYSSIFNASQLLVVWEKQEWKTWFRRKEAAL